MKAALWIFSIALSLGFSSCFGPSGPGMDENYAGNWHTAAGSIYGTEEILEITDTTFSVFIRYTDGSYYRGYRGFVEKRSDTAVYLKTYEVYIFRDAAADASYIYPNRSEGDYKSTGHVIDNNDGGDMYTHYSNMLIDLEMPYSLSGNDLILNGLSYTPSDPISDSIPE